MLQDEGVGWSEAQELSLTQIRAALSKESHQPGRMDWDQFERLVNGKRKGLRRG